MDSFECPRCGATNRGRPRFYHTSGYARCSNSACQIGIKWRSGLFSWKVEPTDTYVPHRSSVSPKTGRVLDSHWVHKAPRSAIKVFALFGFPNAKRQLLHRREQGGMLSRPNE